MTPMTPRSTSARRRATALAALTATSGLLLGSTALSGPATSAEPADDCVEAFPVADLAPGDAVTGLTVTRGTEPEAFTGEVLGVQEDGIGAGLDMVMVRIEMPAVAKAGIWQGMSGSPVYAADGRLIGAVAYGLSMGPSPVAGVTPYEHMDEHLAALPDHVPVAPRLAARIAGSTDVTRAEAREGLAPLRVPVGVSGISPERLDAAKDRPYLRRDVQRLGGAGSAAAGPETIVPGGNMAASLSYGDVTQAGVGTATAVCDGRVVGFGHPMEFRGETTMTLHPASAVYVQEDPAWSGMKIANLGAPAGTVSQDRLTGIAGSFGALPETTTITSTLSHRGKTRTGTSHNSVADAAAWTTFAQLVANHDRVVDSIAGGSETATWQITGTDVDGTPFELSFSDRYAAEYDLASTVGFELGDLVWALSSIKDVDLTGVDVDAEAVDDDTTYRLSAVQQRRGGTWVTLGRGESAVARAGTWLRLRAVLAGPEGTKHLPVGMTVPGKAAGMTGRVYVTGGNWVWTGGQITSVAKAQRVVDRMVRNDELQVALELSERREQVRKVRTAGPADRVVEGQKRVRLVVR
ncbi:hypothetical protein [Nocardioides sp. SYSU DS0663]|uniref:hypothetical protein n=1 Tax=Nocardioides sp. SYSU DS0663 TaxID=3416445 RepID=UPI003F4BD9FF